MLLVIFTAALFVVIIAAAARLRRPKRGAQTAGEQKPAYSTVLRMSRELGGGEVGCRDGVIYVHLSLCGLERKCPSLHDRVCAAPHGSSWTAAETWSGGVQCIADHETSDTLADYSGDPVEASAAFICWARESSGNIYSDYYRL